ncbi:MAG: hypothetical protein K2R98_20100 [Gemmataceae bacterium]|nr:hypothetical protein [Gemmataceae bacterium]
MGRRSRGPREFFSFDSFLDLVTNVVGIIIRLIIVVWVGARSYHSLPTAPRHHDNGVLVDPVASDDPLSQELERQRRELAEMQTRLLEQLRQLEIVEADSQKTDEELTTLTLRRHTLEEARAEIQQATNARTRDVQAATLTLAEIQKRRENLLEEIKQLEKLPPLQKTIRYRTPVSQPVRADEWHFECSRGRVTFVDIPTLTADVRRHFEEKGKELRDQWTVRDVTDAAGPFRMHYVIERTRDSGDTLFSGNRPRSEMNYGYALSEWRLEGVVWERGEPTAKALANGSEFRHVIDGLTPAHDVVTLWVYPDSFALYRQLRDYLQDRDITVAGRPLPEGYPISSSRRGSVSRGQ